MYYFLLPETVKFLDLWTRTSNAVGNRKKNSPWWRSLCGKFQLLAIIKESSCVVSLPHRFNNSPSNSLKYFAGLKQIYTVLTLSVCSCLQEEWGRGECVLLQIFKMKEGFREGEEKDISSKLEDKLLTKRRRQQWWSWHRMAHVIFQQMNIKMQSCRMYLKGPLLQPQNTSGYKQLPWTPGEIFQAAVFPISVTPEMIKWTMKLSCKCAARLQSAIWIVLGGIK